MTTDQPREADQGVEADSRGEPDQRVAADQPGEAEQPGAAEHGGAGEQPGAADQSHDPVEPDRTRGTSAAEEESTEALNLDRTQPFWLPRPVEQEPTVDPWAYPAPAYPPPTGARFDATPPSAPSLWAAGTQPDAGPTTAWPGAPGSATPGAPSGPAQAPGPPMRTASPHRTRWVLAGVGVATVIALVAAVLGGIAGAALVRRGDAQQASLPLPAPASSVSATSRPAGSIADIAARVLPSVVTVQVRGADADGTGTGSGFVLRSDGYVLTNNHVVESGADSGDITVLFADGTSADATIKGRDASYDLAVLKVNRTGLSVLPLGDSAAVVVGDPVIAVGAPLGLNSTVTSGIVSALNRPVTPGGEQAQTYINAIQTDAAINPGNSGGPLLNMSGQVIGVNTAIARIPGTSLTGQAGNIGVGFAIPSNQARSTAEQLIATGKASHPIVGVLLDQTYAGPGVRVAPSAQQGRPPVTAGGPAEEAGVEAGDIITKIDGKAIVGAEEFVVAIRAKNVGDKVSLTIRHDGSERTVTVTLQGSTE